MEPYRTLFPDAGSRLSCTERLARRVLCLPTGTAVGPAEIAAIRKLLRFALEHAGEIAERRTPRPVSLPRQV
jgi:hypothetical protein